MRQIAFDMTLRAAGIKVASTRYTGFSNKFKSPMDVETFDFGSCSKMKEIIKKRSRTPARNGSGHSKITSYHLEKIYLTMPHVLKSNLLKICFLMVSYLLVITWLQY